MQGVDDLLCPAHGKGGNDNFAVSSQSFPHQLPDFVVGVRFGGVLPTSVSALYLQVIHRIDRLGISQNIVMPPTHIPTKEITELVPVLLNVQNHLGRSQNVPGILESDSHS